MGSRLGPLVEGCVRRISLRSLGGLALAVDATNEIYALQEGLGRSRGGSVEARYVALALLRRSVNFLEAGVLLAFVFDAGLGGGDSGIGAAVSACREALELAGIPTVDAPGEAEAQASAMARDGVVWGAASRDRDTLLFGAPRTVLGLGPVPGDKVRVLDSDIALSALGVSRSQLVDAAALMGTDACKGVEGIGVKRALSLVRIHGTAEEALEGGGSPLAPEELKRCREYYLRPEIESGLTRPRLREPDLKALEEKLGMMPTERRKERGEVMSALGRLDRSGRQLDIDSYFS
jgi:hypothetical protein